MGPNVYDVGPYDNFIQVFGTNSLLWPFPIASNSSQKANGVVWPKNTNWKFLESNDEWFYNLQTFYFLVKIDKCELKTGDQSNIVSVHIRISQNFSKVFVIKLMSNL